MAPRSRARGGERNCIDDPRLFVIRLRRIQSAGTRAVIELLTTVAPGTYDADLHDAVDFLLSTRPSWGAWHNAWGTAAAIEALTFLDPTPPEKSGANVSISVDGKVVRTVKIDPDDPFTSAASLMPSTRAACRKK